VGTDAEPADTLTLPSKATKNPVAARSPTCERHVLDLSIVPVPKPKQDAQTGKTLEQKRYSGKNDETFGARWSAVHRFLLSRRSHLSVAPENLLPEDFDDFVVECDEHLAAARKSLLDLESAKDLESIGRGPLDALFRAFHTIKGLSGMVGVQEAESAAHLLETYLAAAREGDVPLTEDGVDALLSGVDVIEIAVGTFRRGEKGPDIKPLAARFAALTPERANKGERVGDAPSIVTEAEAEEHSKAPPLSPEKELRLEAALHRGERAWWVTFTPSPELAGRGVNVGMVRGRLQADGEIIHAEPIASTGGVRFRFLVAAKADAHIHNWENDGLVAEPYHQASRQETPAVVSPRPAVGTQPTNLVRVDLRRLDDLMGTVGELVLSRARLEEGLARVAGRLTTQDRRDLDETAQTIERQLRDLREEVMRVRMVPVRDLFARMRLVVRDLTRETGKELELTVHGEETEVDKFVVERLADPLLHLVRNAVSHGIERVEERTESGKQSKGRLTLRAATAGGMIVLEVEDDGRGVDPEEVFARAKSLGVVAPDAPVEAAALLDVLCTPGFSTREEADRGSGRGVGMDVVRLAMEGLGGTLTLDSRPGVGSRFTTRLPLTLAIADVVTVAVGAQIYAIPKTAVREVIPIEAGTTTRLENNELVRFRGRAIPLLRLGDLFGASRPAGSFVALVIGEESTALALGADRAIGLREVVVRALSDPLVQAPGVGGATELGDGRPILILDPAGLSRLARRRAVLQTTIGER
jgi:two-component system, chemotaxis family, sensor kinase CheA